MSGSLVGGAPVAFALLLAVASPAVRAAGAPDTVRFVPRYEMPETTLVQAPPLTLREIIARCVEGERTKLAGHRDLSYVATVRTIAIWADRRKIEEQVYAGYEDAGGFERMVLLGETKRVLRRGDGGWEEAPDEDGSETGAEVRLEDSESERGFSRVPFFLENVDEYDFTLRDRILESDRVILVIDFRPRSSFQPLPSGTVYVDGRRYRIVHEEFTFSDQNPLPLFLSRVRRISRQWKELPGGTWVVWRILGEVDLKGGWTGVIPDRVSFVVEFDDYVLDAGYDPVRFGPRR